MMIDCPLVSIVIPVYNQEKNIRRCLESIRQQSYQHFECIVVDDGSTDNSSIICDSVSDEDKRFIVFHTDNHGVANARNLALEKITGKYVTFVDSDDYVEKDYINVLVTLVIKWKTPIAFCDYNTVTDTDPQRLYDNAFLNNSTEKLCQLADARYNRDYYLRHNWGCLSEASVVHNVRFDSDLYVGEDALFNARLLVQCQQYVISAQKLYNYVIYPTSESHGEFNSNKSTLVEAWERIVECYHGGARGLVESCKISLAEEAKNALNTMINQEKRDDSVFRKMKAAAVKMLFAYLKSDKTVRSKIGYIILCISPKLFSCINH